MRVSAASPQRRATAARTDLPASHHCIRRRQNWPICVRAATPVEPIRAAQIRRSGSGSCAFRWRTVVGRATSRAAALASDARVVRPARYRWQCRARRGRAATGQRGLLRSRASLRAVDTAGLTTLWARAWGDCRPVSYELRGCLHDRWVRFHSLPGSKRYADNEEEYAELIRRHLAVLAELLSLGAAIGRASLWS